MRGSGSTTRAPAYGSGPRTSRASSQPRPFQASPSNIIDVDEDNGNGDNDGDGAEAPVTSTSARRCRSVASAPARPRRSLAPFPAPNYGQSAYAGSSKGKGGLSWNGGKGASNHLEGVSSRGTFAGVAPSCRIAMSGGTTGLEMLERAMANWPILELTWEGGPPTDIDPKLCKLYGYPPQDEYLRQQCTRFREPDALSASSEEWVHSHTEWFDPQEYEGPSCHTGYDD